MNNYIDLGTKREVFWDDYLVDEALTTASHRMMQPTLKGTVLWLDKKTEASVSYPCIIKDDRGYRMYYIGWEIKKSAFADEEISSMVSRVCVLESQDGQNWTRPNVGLYEYEGSKDNNIVIPEDDFRDNAFVFYDTNPNCPPEEKYKCFVDGIPAKNEEERRRPGAMKRGLWYYYSADGYKFTRYGLVSVCGNFDTLNTARWDGEKYVAYIRNYHGYPMDHASGAITVDGIEDLNEHIIPQPEKNLGIRDIRIMYSDDFRNWTRPERIKFRDGLDISLYTNQVAVYERAPHILIGMPTRYCERKAWSANFDQLAGAQMRKDRIAKEPRAGLAITDCIFMWSRDGINWDRSMDAFLTPGYEAVYNWVYGDCYPSYGLVDDGKENLIFYTIDYHHGDDVAKPLNQYQIRKDGFGCYYAGGLKEEVLTTKPVVFDGGKLHLNFETSAFGHIYLDILNEDGTEVLANSYEIFGNHIDRVVIQEDGTDFSRFAGKPVRLRFKMLDAKIYSIKFD